MYPNNSCDVAIVGGGIGGLMCAYRLAERNPGLKIVLLEQGRPIEERHCPIVEKKTERCLKCSRCAIMEGMAGAGAFSDGKYIISTEYGGWLTEFLPDDVVIGYIEQADKILMQFGAVAERFMPDDSLKLLALKYDLHMLQAQVKHLGTDCNFETMRRLIQSLSQRVDIRADTEVTDICRGTHTLSCRPTEGAEYTLKADRIVLALGRVGSRFFTEWCRRNDVPLVNNQVDVGVRVELPALIWQDFARRICEPKITYRSKAYGDMTRMFCFNDRGLVVTENTDGVLTVNGHAYRDEARKTQNTNFALLTTIKFTSPFNDPIEYARHVASLSNLISGGSVLIQRLGDLRQGRRTDERRIAASTTRPTLKAVPGDLSLCMPKRQLDNIIETLDALDNISPGTANYDTLLYGIECKYYSARPESEDFELHGCPGIYAIGDGAGFTRSLSQAASHGLYLADKLSGENAGGQEIGTQS